MVHQVLDSAKRDWRDVQECHDGQWNRKEPFIRERGLFMILMGVRRPSHKATETTTSRPPQPPLLHRPFTPTTFSARRLHSRSRIGSRNRNNVETPTAKLELVDGKIHVPCDDGRDVSTGKADRGRCGHKGKHAEEAGKGDEVQGREAE